MKKIIMMMTLVLLLGLRIQTHGEAGHPQFQQIVIPKYASGQLLTMMKDDIKEEAINDINRRFIGWGIKPLTKNQEITYVGETIFARYNNTNSPLKFNYNASVSKTVETSVSTSGSAGLKLSGKVSGLTAGLDAAVRHEVGKKVKTEKSEKHDFTITVAPFTKVTVNAKGDARLNNGACKYYFLGITFKKGTWETIDIINEYYEFYEEKIR